jgi:hypothetical protein
MMRNGRPIGVLSWRTRKIGIVTSWENICLRELDKRWAVLMGTEENHG